MVDTMNAKKASRFWLFFAPLFFLIFGTMTVGIMAFMSWKEKDTGGAGCFMLMGLMLIVALLPDLIRDMIKRQ